MPKHERIARQLHDHMAVIRDSFAPQDGTLQALAHHLATSFHQGGRLFICAGGPLTSVANLVANLFLHRLAFDRPALPAISLCHDVTLLHALGRSSQTSQIYARQLRAMAGDCDLLLTFADTSLDPALTEAEASAQLLGMTTAAVVPARSDAYADLAPPHYLFRLETLSTARLTEAAVVFGHLLCELVEADLFEH